MRFLLRVQYVAAVLLFASLSARGDEPVTHEMLVNAQDMTDRWITHHRNYAGWRYMPSDRINRDTVSRLEPVWTITTGFARGQFETTAVVVNGRMFVTAQNSTLFAVDPKTGETLWKYAHPIPVRPIVCCGNVNRGVAVFGDRVFWGTLDAHLLAFDAATGEVLWDTTIADHSAGYSITGAPLVVNGKVVIGVGGGEFGIRGFLAAYDAQTGDQAWRFHTIPGEGEPGNETWGGDSWKTGGAPTWITGTYDPELDLIYWGTGNPGPDLNRDLREGVNLYSNSILAIDADTGELEWYFQTSPRDEFDWDGVNEPVLVDEVIKGEPRKALVQANRNGFLYALDRKTGEFLYAKPYSKVNWFEYNEKGIPVLTEEMEAPGDKPVYPGLFGGKNWPPTAYNPNTHLIYIPDMVRATVFTPGEAEYEEGEWFFGGETEWVGERLGYVRAVDVRNGETVWQFETPGGPNWAGLLATGGGLVFGGAPDGIFRAFNDETGEVLWQYDTAQALDGARSAVYAPPTSFTLDGKQYIGLAVGDRRLRPDSPYILFGLKD